MNLVTGNRIPRDFFVTSGVGESEITIHAGSYHLALREAGIEMCNIVAYSSILPAIAVEHRGPGQHVHGEVMEVIEAVASCERGQTATAGLIYGWLYDDAWERSRRYGGLVCEYNGTLPEEEAAEQLRMSLNELHQNGYEHLRLEQGGLVTRSVTPSKMFGTAGIWLCFTSYEWQTGRGM
jgi:arginine decarboxylase